MGSPHDSFNRRDSVHLMRGFMKNSLNRFLRAMRSVAWFFVGVLISALLIFPDAYAADYPVFVGFRVSKYEAPQFLTYFSSVGAACQRRSEPPYTNPATVYEVVSSSAGPPIQCILKTPPGTATANYGEIDYGNWCPGGGTVSGAICTGATACASGEVRNAQGVCGPLLCPVNESVGTQHFLIGYDTNADSVVDGERTYRNITGLCVGGCTVKSAGLVSGGNSNLNSYIYDNARTKVYGSATFEKTGSTCTTDPAPAPDVPTTANPCPAGQSYGTVNGIPRCVASSTPPPPVPTVSSTVNGKVDNGNGTSTTTSTTTNNNNTTVTTSIINNTTGAVESSTTTTTSTEKPKTEQEKFCEENPTSPMCKVSTWSGSCSAFACDGDAVQCAIAKEQHGRNCTLFVTPTTLATLGADVAAGSDPLASSMPWHSSQVGTVNVAGGVTQGAWLSSSGISDKSFSLRGQTVTIPFSNLNSILGVMGSIIVAFSLLAAARIVGVIS
jgi:hypothetical protein